MKTKEVIGLTEKWNQKITDVSVRYAYSINEMDKLRELLESQMKSKWQKLIGLTPLLIPVVIFVCSLVFIQVMSCNTEFKFSEVEIKKACIK